MELHGLGGKQCQNFQTDITEFFLKRFFQQQGVRSIIEQYISFLVTIEIYTNFNKRTCKNFQTNQV